MKLVLAVFATLALAPVSSDTLAFGPKEGTKLEKSFHQHITLEKRTMTMSLGERDLPAELTEKAVFDLEFETKVDVVDEYEGVDGGRPTRLARTYASLADSETTRIQMVGMPELKEEKKEKESALEKKTVVFRWNGEKERYDKTWRGDEGDEELLKGVEEDMDLRALLPTKSITKGDTWKVDLAEAKELFGPGGKFAFKVKDEEKDKDKDSGFEDNLKGEVECTYEGEKEVDGKKLARVALACKATTKMAPSEDDGALQSMDFEFDLEGELLWDAAARHFVSYELGGDVTTNLVIQRKVEAKGQQHDFTIRLELGGKLELEGKAE